jgi:DNA repair photolyase
MVEVIRVERKSAVLSPSDLRCLARIPTVNLTSGCAHGCLYCYTRGYSNRPREGSIRLYANTAAKLRDELPRKRKRPRAVYFSPSSDLFQPVPQVLDVAYDVLKFLLESKIHVAILTKGRIPKRHMDLLTRHAPLVEAGIGVTTLDAQLLRTFEPRAAPPSVRLRQAKELVTSGIATQARLDPILPGLTDDADTLDRLCTALADAGIRSVAASVLFLRPAIAGSLRRHLADRRMLDELLSEFAPQERLRIDARNSTVVALPAEARRAIYDRVTRVARAHGIEVCVCACKNPDVPSGPCHLAGSHLSQHPTRRDEINVKSGD